MVDDGSSDDTLAVAGKYAAQDSRFGAVRTENRGPSAASFKDGAVGAAGFFSHRSLAEAAALADVNDGALGGAFATFEGVTQMPDQGMAAIPFSVTAQSGAPPPSSAVTLQLPRAAIEDLVAVILRHGGF